MNITSSSPQREKKEDKNLCLEEKRVRKSRDWSLPVRQRMRKDYIKGTKLLFPGKSVILAGLATAQLLCWLLWTL